ncbi:MAG: SxtJ family membrane protein [Methylocella sp.]
MQTHETVLSFRKIALGSNRKFGVAFGAFFAVLGLWPLLHQGGSPRWWLIGAAFCFLSVGLLVPVLLTPLNRAWFKLGFALNMILNPIFMGLLFFGAVVPFGWYLRLTGKDLLRLKIKRDAPTYWIEREPPGPPPGTFEKQF